MEKILIDTNEKLKEFLIRCGINEHIFYHASKMDISIIRLFKEKIINNYNLKTLDEVTKNLLGVYGNFIATCYCRALFNDVKNEVPIKDKMCKVITKADISYIDNNRKLNYCEVKAAHQIIDNIRNYVDLDDVKTGSYEDKDNEIIKYKNIGKKLINQAKKLSGTGKKVNVFIFKGCYVDDVIKRKLKELNVSLHVIMVDIKQLEDEITRMIMLIRQSVNKNVIVSIDDENVLKKR